MMNIQKMMQQAQDMQMRLKEMQEKLADIQVSGESGGGLVNAVITCKGETVSISIDPSLMDVDNKETLEDLVVAAMNTAHQKKEEKIAEETRQMMESMGLPGNAELPM